MPFDIGGFGQQAASTALGTGLGLMLEHHNDQRQLNQQKALTDIQTNAQENMTDYSFAKQLQMWKDTSYGPQMEQMKKAGVNPALMYGMGGGGGTTTGSAGATTAGAGEAPRGGHEIIDINGQMMQKEQLQLLQAQKENIQADTENKKSQVPVNQAQVPNVKAQTASTQANTALTQVNTEIAKIDQQIKTETKTDVSGQITNAARLTQQQLEIAINENTLTTEEAVNARATAAAHLMALQIQNEATRNNINLTQEQITQIQTSLQQKWQELTLKGQELDINQFNAEMKVKYPAIWDVLGKVTNQDLENIVKAITGKNTATQQVEHVQHHKR